MNTKDWLNGWDAVREYGENRYSIQQYPGFQEMACVKELHNPEMDDCVDGAARLIAAAPELRDTVRLLSDCLAKCLTGRAISAATAGKALTEAGDLLAKIDGKKS